METLTEDVLDSFLLVVEAAGEKAHEPGTTLLANGVDSTARREGDTVVVKPRDAVATPGGTFVLGMETIVAVSIDESKDGACVNMSDGRRLRLELLRTVDLPYVEDCGDDDDVVPGETYCKQREGEGDAC